MSAKQKLSLAVAAALGAAGLSSSASAQVVYQDNFNDRATLSGPFTYTPTLGGADDAATVSPGGAGDNRLLLTNNASATANTAGHAYASTPTSAYTNGFNNTLSLNTGKVLTWTLNLRNDVANPSGFAVSGSGNTGQAYILGGTDAAFNSAGSGYALLIGNTGTADKITLYKYANGLNPIGTSANSATAAGAPILMGSGAATTAGTNYWSVKVTYDTSTGKWGLGTRDDGASAFTDPLAGGAFTPAGADVVDTTYTATALTHSGFLISHNTANFNALYDNLTLAMSDVVVVGPPRNLVWDANAAVGPNPSDGAGNWGDANQWYDPTAAANTNWDATRPDNATFGAASGAGAHSVAVGASQTVGKITFASASPSYTLTGGTVIVTGFDHDADVDTVRQGILAQQSAQIDSAVNWTGTAEMEVASGAVLTINGALQGGGAIHKVGAGEVVLNGVGTGRSGTTTIKAGTVRVTTASLSGGVAGYGTGAIFPQSGGTLHLDASAGAMEITSPGGIIHMGKDAILRVTGNVTYRRNFPEFISDDTLGPVSSTIHVDAGGMLVYRAQLRNDRTTSAAGSLHTVNLTGPGIVKLTNSGSNGGGDANIFSGSWDVSNGMLVLGQNSETGGSSGDTLNALGFKNGDPTVGNTATVRGNGILVGTEDTPNPVSNPTAFYRGNVVLQEGGKLASGNGKDGSWGGDFATSGTTSVLAYDPLNPTVARSVKLVAGAETLANSQGDTTWGGTLVVDPGTTTGGSFSISRNGGTIAVDPGATIQVNAGAGLTLDATVDALSDTVDHVNVINNSTINGFKVGGASGDKNVGNLSGTGNTTVESGTRLLANHVRQNTLTVNGNAKIRNSGAGGPATGTSKVNSLVLGAGSQLDLTNNKLITNDAAGTSAGGVYNGVQGLVQSGLAGGAWNGAGIITSEPDALNNLTTIGVATGAQMLGLGPTDTALFAGQTINGNSTVAMYTYAGDLNLDGTINPDDYANISFNDPDPNASGYYNGDINYDGDINADDFATIDFNFNAQGAPFLVSGSAEGLSGVAAVPEPASLSVLSMGASALLGRRRRRVN